MKMTIKYIAALFAAGALLASCTDEAFENQNISNPQSEGTRVIAVSFGQQTRTALGDDGLTPEFVGGESVLVSNDEAIEYCTVTISGEKTIITTSLKGDLTAVNPVRAAKVIKSEKTGGNIIDPDDVLISTNQSGTFADANICMARMKDGEEKMTFHNKTAILRFYVDKSIDVYYIRVIGKDIAGESKKSIDVFDEKKRSLCEATDDPNKRICYVAVSPGVSTRLLEFSADTKTQGTVTRTSSAKNVTLEAGKMYNAFIPYYIKVNVGTEDNPTYQKWAYCNIGAFLPEEAGEYFAWGEVKGHKPDLSISPESNGNIRGAFTSDFNAFDHSDVRYPDSYTPSKGFQYSNTPYYNGTYWDKYSGNYNEKLLPEDDAANVNWGNGWRIPTKAELDALKNISNEVVSDYRSSGKSGRVFTDSDKRTVFWPFTGYGYGLELCDAFSNNDYYWFTSPYVGNSNAIYYSDFGNTKEQHYQTQTRFEGLNIRPICDKTFDNLPIEEYSDEGNLE